MTVRGIAFLSTEREGYDVASPLELLVERQGRLLPLKLEFAE